jgi:hypothetical protein
MLLSMGEQMFFESHFDRREVSVLRSLVGQKLKYIENSTFEEFRLTSGVKIHTSDKPVFVYSDYWSPESENPAIKHFELARFEFGSTFPSEDQTNDKHFRQTFGAGQEIQGVFVLRSKFSNVEYATTSHRKVGSGDKARYEYIGSTSVRVTFALDQAFVLQLEKTVVCFRFEDPWFELFDVECAGSIDEIKVIPYSNFFEEEIQSDQFAFEWISIESLAAGF